jgi:hypothetical protein
MFTQYLESSPTRVSIGKDSSMAKRNIGVSKLAGYDLEELRELKKHLEEE